MSFHPLKRGLCVFSSIHFIQIDIGYEFSSIEKEGYVFSPPSISSIEEEGYMFFPTSFK
jgi:hypothetical protein